VTDHYDVIVIGSGAGGGTLAHTLAGSGRSILLLERGEFLPREMDNWDPEPVFIHGKYISKDTWYDADGKPFQPQVHYNVGGATKLYGAALYRLRPQDFGDIDHVDGISPAWPLTYDDFEPWFTRAEWLYQVHGNAGEVQLRGRARSRIRGPRCRTSRGSSSSPTSSRGAATTRSTHHVASCSTRPTRTGAPASAAPGVTATRAWSMPRPTPRRSQCARCWGRRT
jgi:choline dehydrogenase-like flavoprotein